MNHILLCAAVAIMASVMAGKSEASLIEGESIFIDLGDNATYPGGEQTSPVTRYWNTPAFNTDLNNLVDENNVATGVDLKVLNNFGSNQTSGKTSSAIVNWGDTVTGDNWFLIKGSKPNGQFRLDNLGAGSGFDLTFYGGRGNTSGTSREMTITIDAISQSYDSLDEDAITFTNVVAAGDGTITIDFSVNTAVSDFAHLNGIQITAVPEPASMALMALGGLLMLRRR